MKSQKSEIVWNIINSLLAGAISFFSSMATAVTSSGYDSHQILTASTIAFITSGLIIFYKFKDYWDKEESEYRSQVFDII